MCARSDEAPSCDYCPPDVAPPIPAVSFPVVVGVGDGELVPGTLTLCPTHEEEFGIMLNNASRRLRDLEDAEAQAICAAATASA